MHAGQLLADSCERVLPLLRSAALRERWTQPSALERWSNGGRGIAAF